MSPSIFDIAETYGLTVENVSVPDSEPAFRIYKGANQIFMGTPDAVRAFLTDYEKERPGLYEGSMYGYKE